MHSLWHILGVSFAVWSPQERMCLMVRLKRLNLFQWSNMEIDRGVRLTMILE